MREERGMQVKECERNARKDKKVKREKGRLMEAD